MLGFIGRSLACKYLSKKAAPISFVHQNNEAVNNDDGKASCTIAFNKSREIARTSPSDVRTYDDRNERRGHWAHHLVPVHEAYRPPRARAPSDDVDLDAREKASQRSRMRRSRMEGAREQIRRETSANRREHGAGTRKRTRMAAKKRVPPPQPVPNRTWPQLSKAEQSAAYAAALLAYSKGSGPNPKTRGDFFRAQTAAITTPSP